MAQRILHFAQDSDTSGYFPQLARWRDRGRYQMFFGTLQPMAPWLRTYMEGQGVECFSCDCQGRASYPLGLFRLIRFLRRQRIDILHTHLFEPSVIGLQAGVIARVPTRVMTRHYSDYHTRIRKKWHVRLDQLCTRLAHGVIAVSQHTAEHMMTIEGAPPGKIHTALNGIDFDRVQVSSPETPKKLREALAPNDQYVVLMVGRLHPEKGYQYLFEAMAKLKGRLDRPVRLLIAGTGPLEDSYRQMVQILGCADVVEFLGFRKDIADLMASVDLVVLPSVAEAFGLVLTEALYLGTPVVATRTGGIPEIVTDGVDGVLVPPADSQALSDALATLLGDPERRKRMAGAGRQKVQDRFSFLGMVRAYEQFYQTLSELKQGNATPAKKPEFSATQLGAQVHLR
jgi:glycosyltransferase involved in cell wall biosynthesis